MDKKSNQCNMIDFLLHEHFDTMDIENSSIDNNNNNSLEIPQSIVQQFLSFYKLTFVESGIKDINTISSSILSSFMILVREYAKNTEGIEKRLDSIQHVIDSLNYSKSIISKHRNNLIQSEHQ